MIYAHLSTAPPVLLVQAGDTVTPAALAAQLGDATGLVVPRLLDVGTLRLAMGAEVASTSVRVDNADGALSALLADPPLRAEVEVGLVLDGARVTLLRGQVRRARVGTAFDLEVEA